jgi:parallel beta-helix repeat protein
VWVHSSGKGHLSKNSHRSVHTPFFHTVPTLSPPTMTQGHKKSSPVDAPCVWVHSSGKGRLSKNDIRGSWWHGIVVGQDATPLLQENSVHDHKKAGVFVQVPPSCIHRPTP